MIWSHSKSLDHCRMLSCRGGYFYVLKIILSYANEKGETVLAEVVPLHFKQIPEKYSIFAVFSVVLPIVRQFSSLSFCPWQNSSWLIHREHVEIPRLPNSSSFNYIKKNQTHGLYHEIK